MEKENVQFVKKDGVLKSSSNWTSRTVTEREQQKQLDIKSTSSSTTRPSSRSSLYSTTLEEASNIASKRDSFREPRVKDDIRLHDSFPEQSTKATSEEFAFSSSSPVNISKLDGLELDLEDYEKL